MRCPTLRDVERLLAVLSPKLRRKLGIARRPSDTTLYRAIGGLHPDQVRGVLVEQVRGMWRSRQLEPRPETPLNLVSIDGKAITKDAEGTHPDVQQHRNKKGGPKSYCLLALRAVHVASSVKPALGQLVVKAGTGESKWLVAFARQLRADFGALVECVFFDAGLSGFPNRFSLGVMGIDYIAAIKGNNGLVFREAQLLLGDGETPPEDGWTAKTTQGPED